jgi:hypothetical protein
MCEYLMVMLNGMSFPNIEIICHNFTSSDNFFVIYGQYVITHRPNISNKSGKRVFMFTELLFMQKVLLLKIYLSLHIKLHNFSLLQLFTWVVLSQ